MTTLNLGFMGLGIMGTPMAAHLRAAGHTLYVHSRSAPSQASLDAGAVACVSATEVAQKAETSFTMVPNALMSRKCCLAMMASLPV